jgi:hypothetical protein
MGHKSPEHQRAYNKAYFADPANKEAQRNKTLQRKFGITSAQYDAMLAKQDFKCAICHSDNPAAPRGGRFAVDHCHATGRVRGLLCSNCNTGLGRFKDNTQFLRSAIEYLNE